MASKGGKKEKRTRENRSAFAGTESPQAVLDGVRQTGLQLLRSERVLLML